MEVRVNAIHFEMTEKLEAFVVKKAEKLVRRYPAVDYIDVNLRLIKPETAMTKMATVKAIVPVEGDQVAEKTADTFEEATDLALEAVEKMLEKIKNKNR